MTDKKRIDWHSKKMRIFIGVLVPVSAAALVLLLAIALSLLEKGPPCMFYTVTGLHCPGCGTGRAAMAMLEGDLGLAFRNQPLMMLLLPFVIYYLLKIYIAYVFGRDVLPFFKIGSKFAIWLLAVILLYWVLRNIPISPFTYLAPIKS